jgi:hypothetical protein
MLWLLNKIFESLFWSKRRLKEGGEFSSLVADLISRMVWLKLVWLLKGGKLRNPLSPV